MRVGGRGSVRSERGGEEGSGCGGFRLGRATRRQFYPTRRRRAERAKGPLTPGACEKKMTNGRDSDRASPHVSLRARLQVCTRSSGGLSDKATVRATPDSPLQRFSQAPVAVPKRNRPMGLQGRRRTRAKRSAALAAKLLPVRQFTACPSVRSVASSDTLFCTRFKRPRRARRAPRTPSNHAFIRATWLPGQYQRPQLGHQVSGQPARATRAGISPAASNAERVWERRRLPRRDSTALRRCVAAPLRALPRHRATRRRHCDQAWMRAELRSGRRDHARARSLSRGAAKSVLDVPAPLCDDATCVSRVRAARCRSACEAHGSAWRRTGARAPGSAVRRRRPRCQTRSAFEAAGEIPARVAAKRLGRSPGAERAAAGTGRAATWRG